MNEEMKQAWLEISQMLGEPTREELDVFLRTWQRAMEAQKRPAKHYANGGHLVYPAAKRTWVGLTDEEIEEVWHRVEASDFRDVVQPFAKVIETALRSKNENSI